MNHGPHEGPTRVSLSRVDKLHLHCSNTGNTPTPNVGFSLDKISDNEELQL